jgi:Pyruvate/2-oxoacid:ferredoxin oxidoreductase delta subunit
MALAARKIIKIDEEKCDGCGLCIPGCAEGALALVDGKARLVSEVYCDGLGACLGECPRGAISIEERPAQAFDEEAVKERLGSLGLSTDEHAHKHAAPQAAPHFGGSCPGSRMMDLRTAGGEADARQVSSASELRQWPVKINLVSPNAPYFANAHLLIAADCAAFAYGSMHSDFMKDRAVVIGCPKFDDIRAYLDKLTAIVAANDIQSITVAIMEVPCCSGLAQAARLAVANAGKTVPVEVKVVGLSGDLKAP